MYHNNYLCYEMINLIISYTCKKQNKKLLEDIKNFKYTKDYLENIYKIMYNKYYKVLIMDNNNWMLNDIYNFINYKLLKNIKIENGNHKKKYFKLLNIYDNINIEKNKLLGLMNIKERIKLINYVDNLYNESIIK